MANVKALATNLSRIWIDGVWRDWKPPPKTIRMARQSNRLLRIEAHMAKELERIVITPANLDPDIVFTPPFYYELMLSGRSDRVLYGICDQRKYLTYEASFAMSVSPQEVAKTLETLVTLSYSRNSAD